MKNIFILVLLIANLSINKTFADDPKYKISDIPKELLKNAKVVIRTENGIFEIKSTGKASMKVMCAISILHESEIHRSIKTIAYNKFIKISSFKAVIYDANGQKIKKIDNDNFYDVSAINGFSLYEDSRIKTCNPNYRNFPFTIEYSFEIEYNGLMNYEDWFFIADYNLSVENSKFQVVIPQNMKFRFIQNKISDPLIVNEKGKNIYTWQTKNLKAITKEFFIDSEKNLFPYVITAPNDFEIDGYKGNCETWENFGLFISQMNKNKDILNKETCAKIFELTKNASSDFEKIEILYKYMQNKTRYVSIQIGIGSYQPFEADIVDRLSYGDCKALTNYMKALLKIVGIDSKYVIVNASRNATPIINSFPSNQFNHAFLCIPMKNDTLWLECTSQQNPVGYIGSFTDDRDVLLIDGENSKMVRTPSYVADDNTTLNNIIVKFDENGNAQAKVRSRYKGISYEMVSPLTIIDDKDKIKFLYEMIKIPNFEIINRNIIETKNKLPFIDLTLDLNLKNYGSNISDKVLFSLNLLNKSEMIPNQLEERKSDIFIRRPYNEIDSIHYIIPENHVSSITSHKKEFNSIFGNYKYEVIAKENEIIYIRHLKINKGKYPADRYNDLVTFFENINSADGINATFRKKK